MSKIVLKNLADEIRLNFVQKAGKPNEFIIKELAKKHGFKYWKQYSVYRNNEKNMVLKLQYMTAMPFLNQHVVPTEFLTKPSPWQECITLQPLCSLKKQRTAYKIIEKHYPRKEGLTDFCVRNVGWYENNPVIIDW